MARENYNPVFALIPSEIKSIESIVEGKLSQDRVRLLFHQIFLSRLNVKKPDDGESNWIFEQGWAPLSSTLLDELLTDNYLTFIKLLESNGAIERKCGGTGERISYLAGEYSQLVRINPELLNPNGAKHFRKEAITEYKVLKAINSKRDKYAKEQKVTNKLPQPIANIHRTIQDMEKLIIFDKEAASAFLDNEFQKTDLTINKLKLREDRTIVEIHSEKDKQHITVDRFGERMTTTFNGMSKKLRPFIYFKDCKSKGHIGLDIVNSQFYFMAAILNNPDCINLILPEFSPLIPLLNKYKDKEDVQLFHKECCDGTIYNKFIPLFKGESEKQRNAAKYCLFGYLFSKNGIARSETISLKDRQTLYNLFTCTYPNVHAAITEIKKTGQSTLPFMNEFYTNKKKRYIGDRASYKNTSVLLQRMESRLVLRNVAEKLVFDGHTPFVTIHDCLIILKENQPRTEEVFNEVFTNYGLTPPKLKVKSYWKGSE